MKTLVVTGGIGSGKSLAASYMAERGIPVYDADSRAKALYDSSGPLRVALAGLFGDGIFTSGGMIDRKALAEKVFSDASGLAELEAVVHPAVFEDFMSWRASVSQGDGSSCDIPFVIFESAIILEKPLFRGLGDKILLVDAPLELRISRASERDGAGREAVLRRMTYQKLLNDISEGLVRPDVDFMIMNDGTAADLKAAVDDVFREMVVQAG